MDKSFVERGKLLIERNVLQIDALKPVPFFLPFDWGRHFDMGDTFLYRVQTFKILRYLCDYHEDSHNIEALEQACTLLEDWLKNFSQTAPRGMENRFASHLATNPFVWHDHATALRAENWLNFMDYGQEHVPGFWAGKQALRAQLEKALVRHGSILAEDAFYSAHCNHGIEQARVLLRLAEESSLASYPEADQTSWQSLAIARLTEEFNTCFTREGIHKENSPGYHVFVLKTLLNILADPHLHAVHNILNARFDLTARQALEYIAQILQPNQRLPIIGDTEHLPVADSFRTALGTTEEYAHYLYAANAGEKGGMPTIYNKVYPETGYGIFRNSWNKETYPDMFHLVCKAGCLVRYHNQLDEGQFVLFAKGEHWFIDSGFFDYNRSSDLFKYIRSRKAHNVPLVFGAKLKDFDERVQSWRMDSYSETPGSAHVSMVNTIYENVTLKRRIDYPGAYDFYLTDEVECTDRQARNVQFLFHIPKDKLITVEDNIIRIESPQNICTLKIETVARFTAWITKGKKADGTIRSQVSWRMKECEDSHLITVSFKDIVTLKTCFHISINSKKHFTVNLLSKNTVVSLLEEKKATQKDVTKWLYASQSAKPIYSTMKWFSSDVLFLKNIVYLPVYWHKTDSENLVVCFLPSIQIEQQENLAKEYIQSSKESCLIIYAPQGDILGREAKEAIAYRMLQQNWLSIKPTLSSYKKILFLVIDRPLIPLCELASQEGDKATVLSIEGGLDPLYTEEQTPLLQLMLGNQAAALPPRTMLAASGNFHFVHIQSLQSPAYKQEFLPWLQKEHHSKFLSEELYINPQRFTFSLDEWKNIVALFFAGKTAEIFPKSFPVKNFSTSSNLQFYFSYKNTLTLFSIPVKWTMNPYHSPNWQHNLNKLRWLSGSLGPEDIVSVLINYYNFNTKKYNKYYHSSTGDHATAERIYFLLDYIKIYKDTGDVRGTGICVRLLRQAIAALLNPEIYRPGCNHGLMADLALIQVRKQQPDLLTDQQYETVISRSLATFRKIFADNGIAREHSVEYQLFNLSLGIRFLTAIEEDSYAKAPLLTPEILREKSREFLGFFLTNDGTFFPLGDSARLPNKALLAIAFGEEDTPEKFLLPYSKMDGVRYWPQGYLVWRDMKKGIHLTFTCGRVSAVHKHDDELSFCCRIGNKTIIDECGYTGFLTLEDMQRFSSAACHSTILLDGKDWISKTVIQNSSHMMPPTDDMHFYGFHRRIEGFEISREIAVDESENKIMLVITDIIKGDKIRATHRFILGPDIVPADGAEGPLLMHAGRQIARFILPQACRWEKQHVPYVGLSYDDIQETTCVDVISDELQLTLTLEVEKLSNHSS